MKTLKYYHDFYLKCDVLLFADVFEKIKNCNLKNYGLCSSHHLHLSAPVLSWDAMLNTTKVELEPISDANLYLLYRKGMRAGVSFISKRYSKYNKKHLKHNDPKQESKHIIYLDTNDLFVYDMSKFLTTSRFK